MSGFIERFKDVKYVALIWKLGSNSDKDIIALTPLTPPVARFIKGELDFAQMPPTVAWIAPRYVERVGPVFTFSLFSELDPDDEGYINISIQQVTSVTAWMPNELSSGYIDLLPEPLRTSVR